MPFGESPRHRFAAALPPFNNGGGERIVQSLKYFKEQNTQELWIGLWAPTTRGPTFGRLRAGAGGAGLTPGRGITS